MRIPDLHLNPSYRSRGLLAIKILIVAIAAFALFGFFAAPWIVKSFVADKIGQEIGRKVEFGEVHINPFALSATLRNITLYEADRQHKMLTIGEVYLDASLTSLLRLAPVVSEIRVEQPVVQIVRSGENQFNFSDIVERILAKPADPNGAAHFSLNNIHLRQGRINYNDQFRHSQHSLSEIDLAIPFLSNLRRGVNIFTTPAFSAKLDGSPFAITGKTRPFADTHDAALQINLDGLSLPEYIALLPMSLNLKLVSGLLDTRLNVNFHQDQKGDVVVVNGTAALRQVQLQDKSGAPMLQWEKLSLQLERAEPFNRLVQITDLKLDAPELHASRTRDGTLNLLRAFELPSPTPASLPMPAVPAASTVPKADIKAAPAKPFSFALAHAEITRGQLHWQDAATGSADPVTLNIKKFDANLSDFNTDGSKQTQLHASIETDAAETLRYDGSLAADQKSLHGEMQITGVQPQRLQPYFASVFAVGLGHTLLDATLPHRLAWPASGLDLTLQQASAHLRNLQVTLPHERTPGISAKEIGLSGLQFDLGAHTASADEVAIDGAKIAVSRNKKGEIDWLEALVKPPATTHKTASSKDSKIAAESWKAALKRLKIDQSDIQFSDAMMASKNNGKPALQHFSKLNLLLENITFPIAHASGHGSSGAMPLTLTSTHNQRGSLSATGTLALEPVGANLQINAQKLDLTAFQPYFAERSNATISSGALNAKGKLMLQLPEHKPLRASYAGSLSLVGVRTRDRISGDDFARWRSLSVGSVDARFNTEKNPLVLTLGNIALTDFYARIIVNPTGRLNLQDIVANPEQGQSAPTASLTQSTPASGTTATSTAAGTTVSTTKPETPKSEGPEPLIRVGQVTLQGGNINFSDNFVKPNYSANLTGMAGSISKIASDDQTPADVTMKGKLDDDAPVEINGKLNPFGPQLFLDLTASAHGIELTRLTPYATKYAGYPITKGKLSVDVKYHIENGKLEAQNKMFLDQLTFGDKVESPDATKLPVLLAVALLRNSRGEIDINLPVSGSLSDPEFSIGGVILKVIVNLLTKAITAPFALLTSAFSGGGDELSFIGFAPGTSNLSADATKKLDTLAKALNDRTGLKLEITGRIDPGTDRDGARRAYMERKVRLQKIEDLRDQGSAIQVQDVKVTPAEYPKYLERAYKAEKFSKPRNMIGLTKSLPVEEMEKLMIANAPVGETELKALADRRALTVKHYLEQQGKVANERMFLIAPKLTAAGIKDGGTPNRVDFSIKQ